MNTETQLIYVLKQIELNKLLNDSSLGRYAKIHIKHLYKNYFDYYREFVEQKKLIKYLDFIEKDAHEMHKNIIRDYGATDSNAEEWVISKLTCALNRKKSSPYPFL